MDDQVKTEITSYDEPLLVLKYRKGRVFFRMLLWSFFGIFMLGLLLAALGFSSGAWFLIAPPVFGCLLLVIVFLAIDVLFFREIRLYQDRIVKVSDLLGEREVKLANAKLSIYNSNWDLGSSRSFYRIAICNQDTNILLAPIKGIVVDEGLADWKDARKLTILLAALFGSKFAAFENSITIPANNLIKSGGDPRVITRLPSDEEVLYQEPGQKEYDRRWQRAFLVAFFWPMIGALILLSVVIWLTYRSM